MDLPRLEYVFIGAHSFDTLEVCSFTSKGIIKDLIIDLPRLSSVIFYSNSMSDPYVKSCLTFSGMSFFCVVTRSSGTPHADWI